MFLCVQAAGRDSGVTIAIFQYFQTSGTVTILLIVEIVDVLEVSVNGVEEA